MGFVMTEVASLFNVMRPETTAMEPWFGALRSGDYQFGYGVLRDGDENYDPMGVLADINFADWTWDAKEACWAVQGRTDFLPGALILQFLGCRRTDVSARAAAEAFGAAITKVNDRGSDFTSVVELLTQALTESEYQHHRMHEAMGELRRGPYDGPISSESIRGSFYNRNGR